MPATMLLTVEEAAAELRISRARMFAMIRRGEVESILLGPQARRIPRDCLDAYVQRLRREQCGTEVQEAGA